MDIVRMSIGEQQTIVAYGLVHLYFSSRSYRLASSPLNQWLKGDTHIYLDGNGFRNILNVHRQIQCR